MSELILDDEQARLVRSSRTGEIRDPSGKVIGKFFLDDLDEDFRIARERLANMGTTYTTAEVMEHLRALTPE